MHPKRLSRLLALVLLGVSLSLSVGLALYGLSENINLFYPVSAVVRGEAKKGVTIKVGGLVAVDSLKRLADGLSMRFVLQEGAAKLQVAYKGLVPDLFAEGRDAIATGALNDEGILVADSILAKHDENYRPPTGDY